MSLNPGLPSPKEAANIPKILLLGLGNDLLTDDAVGLRVACHLRQILKGNSALNIVESSEMGLGLLDLMVGYEALIIVDAIQTGQARPGFLHEFEIGDLHRPATISPHFLGVAQVLALGDALGLDVPRQVNIFAIEVEDPFTLGTQMTEALSNNISRIVERILRFLLARLQPLGNSKSVSAGLECSPT